MDVTYWIDTWNAPTPRWNGEVVAEPDVNATARSLEQMLDYLAESYNRKHGAGSATAQDFSPREVDAPPPVDAPPQAAE